MKTTYTVYRPGQDPVETAIDMGAEPGYAELKALITPLLDGEPLEHVHVLLTDGTRSSMFVDECGRNRGLQRNEAATRIYRNNVMTNQPETQPESMPAIYGPAIVFSRRMWF